jgi:hypothetical protein
MVENLPHRTTAPTCVQASRVTGYRRSANCPSPSCHPLSRMPPVRRPGSPHPGLTLPPRVGRQVHLHHASQRAVRGTQPRSANCLRRHTIARRHSRRLCAAASALPPPFLDGPKSIASTTRATFARRNQLRSHIRNGNPLFSGCGDLIHTRHRRLHRCRSPCARLPSTPFREHRLRRVRCTCMRP